MPFTPSTKAAAIVTQIGTNMASAGQTALQTSVSGGNTAPGAFVDGLLAGIGFQAQNDAACLGVATTTSTSFVDVGDGATTGFSTWTVTVPLTAKYLLHVDVCAFITGSAGKITFQTLVNGLSTTVLNSQSLWYNSSTVQLRLSWRQPLDLTAGSATFKLQWKVNNASTTANVDTNDFRCFTLTG